MKILFSIYYEDFDTGIVKLVDSLLVQTDWSFKEIDEHIALYDGFRSEAVIGDNISFVDFYCFFEDASNLIKKIKSIPTCDCKVPRLRKPIVFRISMYDSGSTDDCRYPDTKYCCLYNLRRYECGASGYEAMAYWAASHPLEMMFIGGIVYDFTKWLIGKILVWLKLKKASAAICPVVLNTKKLYRNFGKATSININDCQITKFHRLSIGVFHVQIQTTTGQKFKIKSSFRGEILSLEEIIKN